MQWHAGIRSCSVDRLLSACLVFAFLDWAHDGFACSRSMGISNLSLSLSHDYHHAYSLQLTNGKDGIKHHFLDSIEEAYCLVERMAFVSVFPLRWCDWWTDMCDVTCDGHMWRYTKRSLVAFIKCFWLGVYVFWRGIWWLLMRSQKSIQRFEPKK
jgi:hypothetical protein